MTSVHLFVILIVGLLSCVIYEVYKMEVNPEDFAIEHRLKIEAKPHQFFQFLVQEDTLEKLLPWLTRLKEADTKLLSVGKIFRAFFKLPILGTGRVELTVVEYRPAKLFVFESSDTTTRQRIKLRVKRHQNRSTLRTTVHHRKTSAVYQYTFGLILRRYVRRHLEKSSLVVAQIYKSVTKPLLISTTH